MVIAGKPVDRDEVRRGIETARDVIASAARRSGRRPEDVALMGVTKFQPLDAVIAALEQGVTLFGENRVQEREEKSPGLPEGGAEWHMIGHLQRNKARKALALFDCVESVDNADLARAMERIINENIERLEYMGVAYPILIEVNVSGEGSKEGVPPKDCLSLAEEILGSCPHLKVEGFMTIGPNVSDERAIRESFASLRNLRDSAAVRLGIPLPNLSMGMSGDYGIAIEEGSTIVRIGTGIFGSRH
ncbi:MAG: YggS family pyridoxal phosphate-dependent enzyme [Synergistaceae bacterium]|jgi:pyridoxal phosphate enzyme (YggS family)|nr:YggS family pyridoxal phosphate-dependent enzyme [Synergistaceae bacterium]